MLADILRLFALRPLLTVVILGFPLLLLVAVGLFTMLVLKFLIFVVLPIALLIWLARTVFGCGCAPDC
jgi:hypothetical protein